MCERRRLECLGTVFPHDSTSTLLDKLILRFLMVDGLWLIMKPYEGDHFPVKLQYSVVGIMHRVRFIHFNTGSGLKKDDKTFRKIK